MSRGGQIVRIFRADLIGPIYLSTQPLIFEAITPVSSSEVEEGIKRMESGKGTGPANIVAKL